MTILWQDRNGLHGYVRFNTSILVYTYIYAYIHRYHCGSDYYSRTGPDCAVMFNLINTYYINASDTSVSRLSDTYQT